jgi:hypothetical protein
LLLLTVVAFAQQAPTPAPLFAQITSSTQERETQDPPEIIDLEYPVLAEAPGIVAAPFNQAVQAMVDQQVQSFEANILPPPDGLETGPNSIYLEYEVRSNGPRLLSVYYSYSTYMSGAAHPLPWSQTMTYDLQTGAMLALADLFQPGTDYLARLSQASIADLQQQGMMEWEEGAAPQEINYKSWNVTADGLQITFDPYQVAAYAAGFQTVTLPWDSLSDVLSETYREVLLSSVTS